MDKVSGCDYLQNLSGIGLKKSKTFFSKMNNNDNIEKDLEKLPTVLNMKKLTVPKEYINKFMEAENVFNHQLIYCPKEKKLKPFTDYGENLVKEKLTYAGEYFDETLAMNLALGNVCFKTMELFDSTLMEKIEERFFNSAKSIWNESYALEEPDRFEEINKKLEPCYEIPDELLGVGKRKFVEESSMTKLMVKDKKIKTSLSTSDCLSNTVDDEEEMVIESSFKSTKSTPVISETNTSLKVEVKSRFFSTDNDKERSPSEIEKIQKKKQEIRENLKKLYPPKSASQTSTDSGFYSVSSQQSTQ